MVDLTITEAVASKVLATIDAGLIKGVGNPVPGQMCVEAAVCYALGLPHGDEPTCVSPILRRLKIRLNDKTWSSTAARATGLRRLGLAQLGSAGAREENGFLNRVAEMTIGKIVPRALRSAAKLVPAHAERLEAEAARCETKPTKKSARSAQKAAYAASADYAAYAASAAAAYAADSAASADYAAYAASAAAAYAADSAAYAADSADSAAAYAADSAAAYAADSAAAYAADSADSAAYAARDKELAFFAEEVVQILVTMDAPGCRWLYLAPQIP
jgi:hypothetical protein